MANVDRPHGFLPVADFGGGGFYTRIMTKDAADTVAIGQNDLVDHDGSADGVAQGAAGGPFLGVARDYGAASTLTSHGVIHLPQSNICEAQEDSVGGAIAAASEGLAANVIVAAADATSGMSQMEIDSNTAATTATLDLRLLQPVPAPDNTVASSFARWLVNVQDLRLGDLKAGV